MTYQAWGGGTASLAVAVEGNIIFLANTSNELLRFRWNPANIHEYAYLDQTELGGDEKDTAVAMAARNGWLVLIRKSGEVQVRKTTDLSLVRTFRIEGARDVVIAPDGTLWVIVGSRVERYALDGKRLPGIITAFVDCFDVREVTPGKFEIYGANEIIGMDLTKPPGKSWWLKAITRDPIRYPWRP